jgi:hypothetical protein
MPKRTSAAGSEEEFQWVKRSSLKPWALNPRDNEESIALVAESIKRFGWGRPIIANRHKGLEGEIIVGHTALLAAERLGEDKVPVRWVSLPAKKAHALAVADNKLGEKSKWDAGKLGEVVGLGELDPNDWMTAGFQEKEIKSLMFAPWPKESRQALGSGLSFSVIVECRDEDHQSEVMERLEADGLTCKPWVG